MWLIADWGIQNSCLSNSNCSVFMITDHCSQKCMLRHKKIIIFFTAVLRSLVIVPVFWDRNVSVKLTLLSCVCVFLFFLCGLWQWSWQWLWTGCMEGCVMLASTLTLSWNILREPDAWPSPTSRATSLLSVLDLCSCSMVKLINGLVRRTMEWGGGFCKAKD